MIRINPYEIMLMIEPEVAEERHARDHRAHQGDRHRARRHWGAVEPWGKRKLAYEINHMGDAWYYVLTFERRAEALHEATRVLAITDGVMRHMAVSAAAAARQRRRRADAEPAEAPRLITVRSPAYHMPNTRSQW